MSEAEAGAALLGNIVLFARLLRGAGLAASTGQLLSFVEALSLIDVGSREQVYHSARGLLVTRAEDLPAFDLVFNRFWRVGAGFAAVSAARARNRDRSEAQGRFTIVNYDAFRRALDREADAVDRSGTASRGERLRTMRFADMSPEELDALRRVVRDLPWRAAERITRRTSRAPSGRMPDLRRAIRRSLRFGGVVLEIPRRNRNVVPRPVVFLADISGSMERHARVSLQFLHAAVRQRRPVEAFVFGTRLTRLTPALRIRNSDRAIAAAAAGVKDFSGGTRIGDALAEFNRCWSRRVLRRGAVIVILSDGLDRGDEGRLRREMRALRDRAHRLVWLNPLAGGAGYAPSARGMAAAAEYVDDLLPAHNLDAIERFVALLGALPRRRPVRGHRVRPAAG